MMRYFFLLFQEGAIQTLKCANIGGYKTWVLVSQCWVEKLKDATFCNSFKCFHPVMSLQQMLWDCSAGKLNFKLGRTLETLQRKTELNFELTPNNLTEPGMCVCVTFF